ncbi:MAG: hypothetical protein ACOCX1_03480 [Fimbriimonadaceae bacterium]
MLSYWPRFSEGRTANSVTQALNQRQYQSLHKLTHPAEIDLCRLTPEQVDRVFRDLDLGNGWATDTENQRILVREGTVRKQSSFELSCKGCDDLSIYLFRYGRGWKLQIGALAYDAALATHGIPEGNQMLVEAMREHDIKCIVHGPRRLIATADMLAEKPNDPDAAWQPITKPLPE